MSRSRRRARIACSPHGPRAQRPECRSQAWAICSAGRSRRSPTSYPYPNAARSKWRSRSQSRVPRRRSHRRSAAAVLSCLRALSRREPLLVAVDDAQWLDAASAAALEFALRRITKDDRVSFLFSWRPDPEGRLATRSGRPPRGSSAMRGDRPPQSRRPAPGDHHAPRPRASPARSHAGSRRLRRQSVLCPGARPGGRATRGSRAALELPLPASLARDASRPSRTPPRGDEGRPAHGGRALDAHPRRTGEGPGRDASSLLSSRRSRRECSCSTTTASASRTR